MLLSSNKTGTNYTRQHAKGLIKVSNYIRKNYKIVTYFIFKYLCRGAVSDNPIADFSIMVNEVFVPMLTNPHNQKSWPEVVKKDTERQLQNLRNDIDEVIFMNFLITIDLN